jgi:PLP-dependent transaminase
MALTAAGASRTADELAAIDRNLIIHPYLARAVEERVVMVEGDGCRLRDVEGREYLDATGGLWLAQIGHGRREVAAAAARQMERLEYFTSFWEFSNEPAIMLAERLVSISPPKQTHVYFTSGGSEGNEAALKMARYAHSRRGQPERTWVLARHHAYHGVGYGSGTATGFPVYHEGFGPMLPNVRHLTPPWPYRAELFDGDDPTDFCVRELERTIDELGADQIAAFIGEPVMGVAGMIVPPDDYWPRIAELLHANGITLIFDEVVSAYGRIGHWFAAEHFGVEPDIIVTAKGITSGYAPLGAVLVSEAIADAITEEGFPMGFTYNGHPTSCAVALANLDVIESEGLLERARETGDYILERLRGLLDLPVVGEVRGVGMMHAVELVGDRDTREPLAMDSAPQDVIRRETGVIVRDCGHSLVISPPLILSRAESDEVVDAMRSVLERTDESGRIEPRD